MAKLDPINEEAGLGPNWVPADGPPIIPGQMVAAPPASDMSPTNPKYLQGSIAPNFQHDGSFVDTGEMSHHVPKFDLMPLGPQQNAVSSTQISSTVRSTVPSIPSPAPAVPDDDLIRLNLQSGTSYTVQLSDLNKLISMSNPAGGTVFLPPVAGSATVAVTNNVDSPFNSGNTVASGTGPSTATSTFVFTATKSIAVGDFLFLAVRNVSSHSDAATATMSDSNNGSWSKVSVAIDDAVVGTDTLSLFWIRNTKVVSAGGSFTLTLTVAFTGSPFNPDVNELWTMTGIASAAGSNTSSGLSSGSTIASGGLTVSQPTVFISTADSNNGDLSTQLPANSQGQTWIKLGSGGSTSARFNYLTNIASGFVNDVYTPSISGKGFIDILKAFNQAQPTDIDELTTDFFCYIENTGAGSFQLVSAAPIDGSTTPLSLGSNQGTLLLWDAASQAWYTERGMGGGGGSTVTHTGNLTAGQLLVGNGVADIKVGDLTGDATTSGSTAVTVGKINGGAVPASDSFVGTNSSSQIVAAPYTPENIANKDAASGYAGLDVNTKLKLAEQATSVDARTTTSEAISDSDRAKLVTFSNTSAVAATIAQAGAGGLFVNGWYCDLVNENTGTVTLTPTTSTIDGNATLVLQRGEGVRLVSDGANYFTVAGQPTQDTPNDADVLTFESATKRWRSKSLGALGGANASQLRGNNISSATPLNQDVLKWSVANNQYDIVLADGMEHGDAVWPVDSAWVGMRDDFFRYSNASAFTGTGTVDIGELGWVLVGNVAASPNALRLQGGVAPNLGTVSWTNNATSSQYAFLALNDIAGSTTLHQNSYALFENAGWKMTWVFKLDNEISQSTATVKNLFQKKSMYVGLMGAAMSSVAATSPVGARPDIFFGVRFDTSTVPAGFTVTSVAAGTGVYTGTFTGGGTNAFAGQNITFSGFANAANNGTFACTASTTTTVTVSNASSALETVSPAGSAWAVLASVPSTGTTGAASGGNTVYNVAATGFAAHQLQGLTFVVTGGVASGGANNGTFTCVDNTTTTITLNNASGVAETHAIFITGGSINDTVMTLEAVQNQTFASGGGTVVRHNIQGTTVAGPAPDKNWHRLDIYSTTAGQIVIQLDGSNTFKLTYTVSSMTFTSNGNSLVETTGQQLSYSSTVAYTNARNSGVPSFAAGSVVTLGGFTGGSSGLNGSYTAEAAVSAASPVFILPSTAAAGQTIQQSATTIAGLPAVTPCAIFGNDDTAAPYVTTRLFVDFFALVWNKAIASPSTVPSATNPRYW